MWNKKRSTWPRKNYFWFQYREIDILLQVCLPPLWSGQELLIFIHRHRLDAWMASHCCDDNRWWVGGHCPLDKVWTRCCQLHVCLLVNVFLFWIGQNFTQNILQLHKKSTPNVLSLRTFLHADYYPKVGWSVSWCTQTSIIWSHNITKLQWCYAVL